MARLTCDVENYPNYFLIYFRDVDTGWIWYKGMYCDVYTHDDVLGEARSILANNTNITFNGNVYDMPLVAMFLNGASNYALYKAGQDIIANRLMPWIFERKYHITIPQWDHIDLINVAFGTASLKIYGARLGSKKLQELPIHWDNFIMPDQVAEIDLYCGNDNLLTADLFFNLERAIDLRKDMSEEYGIDLRSKSDAQIAEHVIKSQYQKVTGNKLKAPKALKSYKYKAPSFVFFQGEQLNELLNTCTSVDFNISEKGAVLMPKELNKQIPIVDKKYKMGIGGLHSVDKGASYYSKDGYQLILVDATSYYPYVILNACFEPSHIGELFTTIFRDIVYRRVAAKPRAKVLWKELEVYKERGEKPPTILMHDFLTQNGIVESLKIVINGLFGKFGSRYSAIYSPDLMFHTTVTGQLCLFMLIEQFQTQDIQVVSANTDGITIRVHDDQRVMLDQIVKWWEDVTNFNMECEYYKSLHYLNVNEYVGIHMDNSIEGKGATFAKAGIRKNPAHSIIGEAAVAFIKSDTPVSDTITKSDDITKFLEVIKVTDGAVKDGVPLGASIRWYISDATDTAINYATNGNQVSGSMFGMPMMDLPDDARFPPDLHYQWYIDKANDLLVDIGVKFRTWLWNEQTDYLWIEEDAGCYDRHRLDDDVAELTEKQYNKKLKQLAKTTQKLTK